MQRLSKKSQLNFSFQWIFALIVGAFILFLVIYGVYKLINMGESVSDPAVSQEIGILMNPLETGFESSKTTSFMTPMETRIYNRCSEIGIFGKQGIRTSQKSYNKWSETNTEVSFENKYIFSEYPVEGQTFYLFSKPFEFPFKVADLIYMTSSMRKYCFIDAPEEIAEELNNLNQKNIMIENCSGEHISVCFKKKICDINVDYSAGLIKKEGENLFFEGDALMYAGIFSDKEMYECQIQRLMKRVKEISELYNEKALLVSRVNCNSNLDLKTLITLSENIESSANLNSLNKKVNEINNKNNVAECRLW